MYRLLIVDDEEIVLNGLENMISKIPRIKMVGKMKDGISAQKYLENQEVDIAFLDIQMPNMNGLELAEWISCHRPECVVVFISAYSDFNYAQKAIAYGVKNYLMKPIRLSEVKKVIEKIIEECDIKKKSVLWKHDFKREIIELDMYHAIVNNALNNIIITDQYIYAKYKVVVREEDYEKQGLNEDLVRTAVTNILRWYAKSCTMVLEQQTKNELHYILLGETSKVFLKERELQTNILTLMESEVEITLEKSGNITELSKGGSIIKQDDIADELILKAQKYISRNISKHISRDDVAQHVHLETSYFSKYFKKKAGVNFHEYLQNERINYAKKLLERGEKVQDVVIKTGFSNRNYFNQIFKQYVGCNPSEYRKIGDRDA